MKLLKRTDTICFICLLALITYLQLHERYETDLLHGMFKYLLYFLYIVIIFYSYYRSVLDMKKNRILISFIPFALGLAALPCFYFLSVYVNTNGYRSKKLEAFHDGGFNGVGLVLYDDDTYKLSNGSGLGESFVYGRYTWRNDTLLIDTTGISYLYPTGKFVLRTSSGNELILREAIADTTKEFIPLRIIR